MGYRVQIDVEECVSSGKCVADNPTAFGFDEDELATALPGMAGLGNDRLLTAARRCPSGAIQLFDDDGEQIET